MVLVGQQKFSPAQWDEMGFSLPLGYSFDVASTSNLNNILSSIEGIKFCSRVLTS